MTGPPVRRTLSAVDDPLELGEDRPAASAPRSPRPPDTPPASSRSSAKDLPALFVRLPVAEFDALARAAFELNVHKRELVAALVWRYVRPTTPDGLSALRRLVEEHRGIGG